MPLSPSPVTSPSVSYYLSLQHDNTAPRYPLKPALLLISRALSAPSTLTAWQYNSPAMPCHPSHPPVFPMPVTPAAPFPLLGPDDRRVVGGVRQCCVLAVVEEAVAPAAVADEEEGGEEDQGTDGAGLPLQQEAEQVEAHEHGVVEPQRWVQRLGDEQHRK
ncbi:hypothetical protein D5F01_LYC03289 [Larimichthys crocea]|uniref:Uncharacterized protein n=1 Tax=Larimichthys crocea TaxID=215358 RepID=A0A6G0J5B8_LARCR|nr:hypothetical protein D5F01_LYC03289 [Larimichthys crocea]